MITPTRLADGGKLTKRPGLDVFARSLLLRALASRSFHSGADVDFDVKGLVERARGARVASSDVVVRKVMRRSSRQNQLVPLDGLVGTIVFEGDAVEDLWPLLLAGEVLHVGKGTAFGCGRYEVVETARAPRDGNRDG